VLRDARLVTTERRGTQICYSLDPTAVRELEAIVGTLEPRPVRLAS
jgi:hypothetical protein